MVSLNRVILIGNLTKDAELRYTPSGAAVANLRLAVNSTYKSQSGERKEEVCFVTIVVWGRQAENCNQYLSKGRPVYVEGRLISRSWESEGKTRSVMEVRADRVQFMGGGSGSGAQSDDRVDYSEPAESAAGSKSDAGAYGSEPDDLDNDIPF